jgi:hypothetical protein
MLELAQRTITPTPSLFYQTFTLQDALPAEVETRAGLLVRALRKLRRKVPHHLGWARVIETKTSDINPEMENVHMHLVMLFPAGQKENVNAIQWDDLWQKCAGELARDCDPAAGIAKSPESVINYLTKNQAWDFEQDAAIGIEDPLRYVCRVANGHSKFSGGGQLRFHVAFSEMDKLCGLDVALPRSSLRSRSRQSNPPIPVEIPIEGAVSRPVRGRRDP